MSGNAAALREKDEDEQSQIEEGGGKRVTTSTSSQGKFKDMSDSMQADSQDCASIQSVPVPASVRALMPRIERTFASWSRADFLLGPRFTKWWRDRRGCKSTAPPHEETPHEETPVEDEAQTPRGQFSTTAVLVAWEAGEMSEGQAARLLGCDRIKLREMRNELLEHAAWMWGEFRKHDPPDAGETFPEPNNQER